MPVWYDKWWENELLWDLVDPTGLVPLLDWTLEYTERSYYYLLDSDLAKRSSKLNSEAKKYVNLFMLSAPLFFIACTPKDQLFSISLCLPFALHANVSLLYCSRYFEGNNEINHPLSYGEKAAGGDVCFPLWEPKCSFQSCFTSNLLRKRFRMSKWIIK